MSLSYEETVTYGVEEFDGLVFMNRQRASLGRRDRLIKDKIKDKIVLKYNRPLE